MQKIIHVLALIVMLITLANRHEGTFKLAGRSLGDVALTVRIGSVWAGAATYRPNRVYYRLAIAA